MIKTMMRPVMVIVAIGLGSPRLAGAQTVAGVLTFLVTNPSGQTGSVDRDRDAARATAVGLADLVVRTKYTLYDEDGAGIATKVDVRLPTGRQEDLLGAGSTSLKFSAIGSIERGRTSGHANAGISLGGLAREVSYGGGPPPPAARPRPAPRHPVRPRLGDLGPTTPVRGRQPRRAAARSSCCDPAP